MSPTQLSLKKLRAAGWLVAVVEKWNPHVRIRQDLFGMFDLLAFKGNSVLGVQTTTDSNVSARVAKMRANDVLPHWLESAQRFAVVHGWAKRGERGKRQLWTCREVELRGSDL